MFDLSTNEEENGKKSFKKRSFFLLSLLLLFAFISLFQIIKLTVLDNNIYVTESDQNRIIFSPIFPARGLVKLSDGQLITENVVSNDLFLAVNQVNNVNKLLEDLMISLNLKNETLLALKKKLETESKKINSSSILLMKNLSSKQVAKYLLNSKRWPSVSLKPRLQRYVLDGPLFSHTIGYLGRVSSNELDGSKFKYKIDSWTGKSGVEKVYEKSLRGSLGHKIVEVDAYGKEIRELERLKPGKVPDIYLSLNKPLQELARRKLAGRKGAIVAMDPNNGLIKALVSSPDFNPNILNQSEEGEFEDLINNQESPFFNRAISGNYPPASTLKPFLALLGLQEKLIDWDTVIEDKGFFQIKEGGRRYRGWKEEGHGSVNLKKAITESSDVFFYQLATKMSVEMIHSFLNLFGFGKLLGIDISGEEEATLPNRQWKLGKVGEEWFVGDTVNLGIGQGYISSTPLQLVIAFSAIANRGKLYKPRIVEKIDNKPTKAEILSEIKLSDNNNWEKIEHALLSVIESWNGTAHNLYDKNSIRIAGKTGTAQLRSLSGEAMSVKEEYSDIRTEEKERDHALFVGYGPVPNATLAVVVIIENGESASKVSAPIAKELINLYTNKRNF